jgi:carboxymethylenebutenolidase
MTITDPQSLDLPTPSGPMRTLIFKPIAPGRYPGLVLFSEIFQITAPIRRTAAFFAGHGFIVAVPEIYHEFEPAGAVLAYDQPGADRGNQLKTTKPLTNYDTDARAVLEHLTSRPDCTGKLGSLGICIGGHLSFRASMNSQILAGACFYATDIHKRGLGQGASDNTQDRLKEIKAEMLMIWGKQDPHVPREGRQLIYNAMTDAALNFTWHEFNAQHAFLRDEGPRYDPELARICYSLVIDLFKRKLTEGDLPITSTGKMETKH